MTKRRKDVLFYTLTKYPDLYCDTWWGMFCVGGPNAADYVHKDILDARNAVALRYHIRHAVTASIFHPALNTAEFYRTEDGYLMLISLPSCDRPPEGIGDRIVPIYCMPVYTSYAVESTSWEGMRNLVINATGLDIGLSYRMRIGCCDPTCAAAAKCPLHTKKKKGKA